MVGFDSQNRDKIGAIYICHICKFILRDPVQLYCGDRYCESCINDLKREFIKCLQCKKVTLKSKMFSDRGMKNDMQKLSIICSFCHWNGLFKSYHDHLTTNHSNTPTNKTIKNYTVFQIRKLVQKFNEYANNLQILKATIQQILSETSIYKTSIEEQNPPEEIRQQKLDNITSCDGTLLWKIDHIKTRLNDSRCVITSPPFYTSLNGYKMCVRLYLNGNGKEESTHISIFLVLMRGEYDALVEWPFHHQVIFCLYNFIDQEDHIIESFQSDINSQTFQRRQSEMNIGSGISKFIPLRIIQQENSPYVCDGSIYIKIMVRNNPIPISILPYVMNINPGLPIYIQEDRIQEEIERNHIQSLKLVLTLTSRD